MSSKNKVSFAYFYFIIFILFFFIELLQNMISYFNYFDELVSIVALVVLFLNKKRIINTNEKTFLKKQKILISIVLLLGFTSSLFSPYPRTIVQIFIDAFRTIKVPAIFAFFMFIPTDEQKRTTFKLLKPVVDLFIVFAFIFGIINLTRDIGMGYDERFGIRTFKFIFNNPASVVDRSLAVIAIHMGLDQFRTKKYVLILSLATILMTMRANGLAAIAILLVGYIILRKDTLHLVDLAPIPIVAGLVGWNSLNEYLIQSTSLRSLLFRNGIMLGKRFFPLGVGFANYGSDTAHRYYSELYYELGYDKVWGLSVFNGQLANDNFWPMTIAQFGFLGALSYLWMLISQLRFLLNQVSNKKIRLIEITLLLYMMIQSLGAAVFTGVYGAFIYMFIGFLYNRDYSFYDK
ncbi:hypothetical protein ACE40W_04505 [Enterococcus avium]|uniref:hypothetical protein n=1 Tax=Enterococcus avium TaxID=33945 RepID=UPI0035C98539